MITKVARWAILAALTGLTTAAIAVAQRPPQIPTEQPSTSTVVRSATPQTSSNQPTTAAPQFLRPTPPIDPTGHLRPMNDGDRQYHEFCLNHDDTAGCSDFRDNALRRRGIDPSSATPDTPAPP